MLRRSVPLDAEPPWPPASLANVVGWFDGDSHVTTDGTKVSAWGDKSPGGLVAHQGSVDLQPTLSPDKVNKHQALRFSAACTFLDIPDGSSIRFGTKPYTVAIVGSYANNVDSMPGTFVVKREAATPYPGLLLRGNGDANAAMRGYVQLLRFVDSVKTGLNDRKMHRVVHRRLPNNALDLRVDDAPAMHELDEATNVDAPGFELRIGAGGQGKECLDGDIAEILLLNRSLDPAETVQLEAYFKSKYAL